MKIKHYGTVEGGKYKPEDTERFRKELANLEGKKVYATVQVYKSRSQRSDAQNRYYHGVVLEILAKELGYQKEEMHDALKQKFLRESKVIERSWRDKLGRLNVKEVTLWNVGSTAGMSTKEFEELMTKIRTWASVELHIFIPNPNEIEID